MKKILFLVLLLGPFWANAQIITTYGGGGTTGICEGCPATASSIPNPTHGVFDELGNYYFASCLGGNRIRTISNTGIITTIAGTGTGGFSGDGGAATTARLNLPLTVKFDSIGDMYVADAGNYRIRKINASTGIISTIAGTGTGGYNGDGIAATAAMFGVNDICIDRSNNVYIADYNARRIRKIDTYGIITTIAGIGTVGYSGDGGQATAAEINPNGIVMDDTGNFYVADPYANVVRKIDTFGVISTFAGNGAWVYSGDGIPATDAQIQPAHIAIDNTNNIFIADGYNKMVFRVNTSGILHRVAGNGMTGFSGDGGPATAASLDYPNGVSIDPCDNLYITEASNSRVRKVTFNPLTTPSIALSGATSASVGASLTVAASVAGAGSSYIIYWMNHGIVFTSTTIPSVMYVKGAGIDTITARVVSTASNFMCFDSTTSVGHIVSGVTTGIGVYGKEKSISIYPNPTNELLQIDNVTAPTNYRILNLVGSSMQQGILKQGSNSISVRSLPVGMYLLELTDEVGRREVRKVVKE